MKMTKCTEENHKFWCTDRQDTAMSQCSGAPNEQVK